MSYYLANSLNALRDQVNRRAPNRSKKSDGWIGDASHSARRSDHNPNSRGSVNAIDITHDPVNDADMNKLVWDLVVNKDPRLNYVIFNRKIWSRVRGFQEKAYTGSNPHTKHVHVSILQSAAAEQNGDWWNLPLFQAQTGDDDHAHKPQPPSPIPEEDDDMPFVIEPEKTSSNPFSAALCWGGVVTPLTTRGADHAEAVERWGPVWNVTNETAKRLGHPDLQ